jgi:hypothetical protein
MTEVASAVRLPHCPHARRQDHLGRVHIHADQLEEYALRRLPEPETAAIKEYLLICEECQDGFRSIEVISAMRAAKRSPPEH